MYLLLLHFWGRTLLEFRKLQGLLQHLIQILKLIVHREVGSDQLQSPNQCKAYAEIPSVTGGFVSHVLPPQV